MLRCNQLEIVYTGWNQFSPFFPVGSGLMKNTLEEQIKKILCPFESNLFLKTFYIQLPFKPLVWNEIHSRITMKIVTPGCHDIRKCRPSNFQVHPFTRHRNPTSHLLTDLTNVYVVLQFSSFLSDE